MIYRRTTKETDIELTLELFGGGKFSGSTGIGFFDHMLSALVFYSQMDLTLNLTGDLHIDQHHSLEDLGLCLGTAFIQALSEAPPYSRFAHHYLPMDEALVRVVLDLSGRPYLSTQFPTFPERIGTFETACLKEFLRAFTQNAKMTLHMSVLYGENAHHMVEGLFKALGLCLKEAVSPLAKGTTSKEVLSTKGVLIERD